MMYKTKIVKCISIMDILVSKYKNSRLYLLDKIE